MPPSLPVSHEMLVIHRVFRREFAALPGHVRRVSDGDSDRAGVVSDFAHLILLGLHIHHGGEDALLWPKLLDRAQPSAELIHRMEAQHQRVAELIGQSELLLTGWRATAAAVDGERLAASVEELTPALVEHLDEEQAAILPLVDAHITPAEWDQLGEHGMRQFPTSKLFIQLGAILEEATPVERAEFLAKVPAPARLLWQLVGRRQYARYVRRLRGAA